jgi:hypothetical protein
MPNVMVIPYEKRKKFQLKWWIIPLIVTLLFIMTTVSVYAIIVGFNTVSVGSVSYSTMTVGNTWAGAALYLVGGYSTNEKSNTIAQLIFPVLAFLFIILYAFRSLANEQGFSGFIKTAFIIMIGAVFFGALVIILNQLT